jgi:myo-inositol 2-dehydrogenase/D-chiro-inositol 1-dehydrogenase
MKRIAWIGCGKHANEMILPQLSRAGLEVVQLCDIQSEALASTAHRFGVAHTTQDWRDVLNNPDLDAIGVAAGPQQHVEIAKAAVQKGLPVFIEKPPAATAKDAGEL